MELTFKLPSSYMLSLNELRTNASHAAELRMRSALSGACPRVQGSNWL